MQLRLSWEGRKNDHVAAVNVPVPGLSVRGRAGNGLERAAWVCASAALGTDALWATGRLLAMSSGDGDGMGRRLTTWTSVFQGPATRSCLMFLS
jgi:hypothetical protein